MQLRAPGWTAITAWECELKPEARARRAVHDLARRLKMSLGREVGDVRDMAASGDPHASGAKSEIAAEWTDPTSR